MTTKPPPPPDTTEEKPKTIFDADQRRTIVERLSDVAHDLGPVKKVQVDQAGAGRFKAFAVDDIYSHLRPLFAKHGIVVVPRTRSVEYGLTVGERPRITSHVEVDYTFHGLAGDSVTMQFAGAGHDGGDKATNKAVQMAFKYGLIQMFLISTGEVDPDAAGDDDDTDTKGSPEKAPAKKAAPKKEEAPARTTQTAAEKRMSDLKNAAYKLVYVADAEAGTLVPEAEALVDQTLAVYGAVPKNKGEVAHVIEMMKDTMGPGDDDAPEGGSYG